MSKKQYWKGLEELNPTPEFQKSVADEFREELPFESIESIATAQTSRRDFLKYLGFTTAAATLAASCEMQVRKAIPYAIKPENVTPGVALTYASTYVDGGETIPVLVRTREGRPIKIEGNNESSLTKGATTARVQGSVLNLYDATRLKYPMVDGKEASWDVLDNKVIGELSGLGGSAVYLVTSTINSPSSMEAVKLFQQKYPTAKHIMYDAISYSGMLDANMTSFGKRALPTYRFDQAKVIVSIGADFLGTWLSPEIFSKQYAMGRKISAKNPTMSKHYQVEGMMSLTGGNADQRYTCKPSEYGAVALALLNALSGSSSNLSASLNEAVKKMAADLNANKGNALVVCGSNDANVQTVVNAINNAIGAMGTTVSFGATNNTKQGNDKDMNALAEAMKAGQVGAVMFFDCNPVYDNNNGKALVEGLKSVKLSVSFNDRLDETTQLCKVAAPSHHWLESWGDAEAFSGYYSLIQPTISPLFKTRAWEESLMKWSGNTISHADHVRNYWIAKLGGQTAYDAALQKGVIEPETMAMAGASFAGNVNDAVTKLPSTKDGFELVIYDKYINLYKQKAQSKGSGYFLRILCSLRDSNYDNFHW